ncbi:hypothetical protein GPECTOR_17g860 [Gonium pectorale]|uniref:Guanylate cyclase domain-containing protein n=1 Tax=Gonium pectorale TaxID=33097 RepID=A0A150GK62_GONPE|nr:hypothetical protein GPECTOR_17g860 [Gonium pectorale]|eukprot:KXZ50223.1 hypothetical protein GPECTOR_17g860 [Gonium pectorale]
MTTQHLADLGLAADLSRLVGARGSSLAWSNISQLFRLQLASYRGATYAVPLDGSALYTLAWGPVFQRLGRQVPVTWEELLDFVASYRQLAADADADAEGRSAQGLPPMPAYPLCLPLGPTCRQISLLQAIWSSIAQTRGSQQGVHFDTSTLTPLLDTPAGREAFRIAAHLQAAAAPAEPGEACWHGSLAFARGRCAMVLAGFVSQMRMLIRPEYNATVGTSGLEVHPLPGSRLVWDRGSGGQLRECTAELCPHGTAYTGRSAAAGSGLGFGSFVANHAPLLPGSSLTGVVNSRQPVLVQWLAYELLEYVGSPERFATDDQPSPLQTVTPVRGAYEATFLPRYLASLAVLESTAGTSPISPATKGRLRRSVVLAVALTSAAVAAVLLFAGGLLLRSRLLRRSRHRREAGRDWGRRLAASGAGEPVALVVTDIADSTSLWEALPEYAMSEALRLHHTAVRRLLVQHGGYESSTEV